MVTVSAINFLLSNGSCLVILTYSYHWNISWESELKMLFPNLGKFGESFKLKNLKFLETDK